MDILNVRRSASTTEDNIIGTLNPDDEMDAYGEFTDAEGKLWYQILYDGQDAYISGDFVITLSEIIPDETGEEETAKLPQDLTLDEILDELDKMDEPEDPAPEEDKEAAGPALQKTPVKTEDVPDRRDPEHGYRFITYTDGSIDVEIY